MADRDRLTPAQKQERARLIREGERRQAIANFYEAHRQNELARLQEVADTWGWETHQIEKERNVQNG